MAQKPNFFPKKSAKPSKLLALIAILIACSLPYFLVKTFRHSSPAPTQALSLPNLPKTEHQSKSEQPQFKPEQPNVAKAPEKPKSDWEIITTHQGDTLAAVFQRAGVSRKTLQAILHKNPHAKALANIKPNQQLQLLVRNKVLEKLIIPFSNTQLINVDHQGSSYITKITSRKMNSHNQYVTATVRGSLYTTAKRANISYKLIQQMTDIFNWEIDFAHDIRAGDQFSIAYKGFFIDNKLVDTGEILAVSYTSRGKAHQAIRHTRANGDYDYYTPQGTSLKKAFARYPIKFSHISSTFSLSRSHPILHYRRPHKGVDLAAPIGTPVRATGDGRIEMIGRQNGYGNMVKIAHFNNFSSIYGHMLKFQKGLGKGDHIKRGEIIGYVGQTGLATGPHCHYEFHINKHPKNPTTVDLPRSAPISGRELASFKANSSTLFAQMKLFEGGHLTNGKKSTRTS